MIMEKENTKLYSVEKSVRLAAKAFVKDDYKAVIYWLRPHLNDLCPLQRKKLLFSIKHFHGGVAEASISSTLLERLVSAQGVCGQDYRCNCQS